MALPNDSPSTPVEVRQPRRTRPPRWLIVLLGTLVFFAIAGWWAQRPLARIPLQDGTELLLIETHYQSNLVVDQRISLWQRFQNYFTRGNLPSSAPESVMLGELHDSEDPPSLWLLFEQRRKNSHPLTLLEICPIDTSPPGFLFASDHVFSDENTQIPNVSDKTIRSFGRLTNYPRRASRLHLQLHLSSSDGSEQYIETSIRNPHPISAQNWTPEPIPQSRRTGTREIVLDGLTANLEKPFPEGTHLRTVMFTPGVTVSENGVPVREEDGEVMNFDYTWGYTDATGNWSDRGLPFDETAWKLWLRILPHLTYPFPKREILSLGHVTMPGPGEYHLLSLPPDPATSAAHHAALVGRGAYRISWKDDLTIELASPSPGAATAGGQDVVTREYDQPALLILRKENFLNNALQRNLNTTWMFRAVHDGGMNALEKKFDPSDPKGESEVVEFLVLNPGTPVAGIDLEIQSIIPEERTAEFLIQPPHP